MLARIHSGDKDVPMFRAEVLEEREPETLGEAIRSARLERGWTQRDLSTRVDVSERLISRWESGAGYPSVPMLERLGRAFGWELPWPIDEPSDEDSGASSDRLNHPYRSPLHLADSALRTTD